MPTVSERYRDIRNRMDEACRRSGRDPCDVHLLGACKRQPLERVREAYKAGLRLVGENRIPEGIERKEALADLPDLQWHYIGAIQSRKCADIAAHFALVHSVDRSKVALKLDEAAEQLGKRLPVFLEINIGGEASKAGCPPDEARDLLDLCADLGSLAPQGLMSLPPPTADPEDSRPFHAALRHMRDELATATGVDLPHLSMGMSHDFEVAIEEGSTLIRIGTDLFGPRPD